MVRTNAAATYSRVDGFDCAPSFRRSIAGPGWRRRRASWRTK